MTKLRAKKREDAGKDFRDGFEAFFERGYLGTTTKEIATLAGITETTLFRHFPSKEVIFEEVLKRYSFLQKLKELLPQVEDLLLTKLFPSWKGLLRTSKGKKTFNPHPSQ
jgi:AcrR family transcriptional regulator